MIEETREQNDEESIKPTVAALTDFCRFILLGERSRVLLPVTGVGLRWKSLKRQESVEAGAGWERSNVSRFSFAYRSELKAFFCCCCFPRSFSSPTLFRISSPLYIFHRKRKMLMHRHLHQPCQLLLIVIFIVILIVILFFGYTQQQFSNLIGNLKRCQKLSASPPVRRPPPLVSLMSWQLDASNLPLKIPQQTSSTEQVVPVESCVLPESTIV